VYVIVDGGYHKWRATISASRHGQGLHYTEWREKLESVRKDIECGAFVIIPLVVGSGSGQLFVYWQCTHTHSRAWPFNTALPCTCPGVGSEFISEDAAVKGYKGGWWWCSGHCSRRRSLCVVCAWPWCQGRCLRP
jgi:hypothetical protein